MLHVDPAEYTACTRQHELNHTRSGTDLPCLTDRDHEVGTDHTDHLSEVCNFAKNCSINTEHITSKYDIPGIIIVIEIGYRYTGRNTTNPTGCVSARKQSAQFELDAVQPVTPPPCRLYQVGAISGQGLIKLGLDRVLER